MSQTKSRIHKPPDICWAFLLLFILLIVGQTYSVGKEAGLKDSIVLNHYKQQYYENRDTELDMYTKMFIRINNKLPDREARLYAKSLLDSCEKYGVAAKLFISLILVESGANPFAVSSAGALGLCQIMPFHLDMLVKHGIFNNERDFYDGVKSIEGGVFIFANNMKWANNDPLKALGAYNAGKGNWRAGLNYAAKVLRIKNTYW